MIYILIAATAILLRKATANARGLVLVSNDSDLARVVGVRLENWLAG